jgi:hypothetical protein
MFDWLTAPLASAASGIAGFLGQQETNAANTQRAAENTAFQERMSNTAYQRQVKDMEAAGLNPMLAYVKGGGASTPTGSVPQLQSPAAAGVQSAYQSAQTSLSHKQVPKVEAETEHEVAKTVKTRAEKFLVEAQTVFSSASADLTRANINKAEYEAKKIAEETKNIPIEGRRIEEIIKQISAVTKTEGYRETQMKWLALKTLYESDLLGFDVKAIEVAANFGKEFGQYKPAVDVVLDVMNLLNNFRGRSSTVNKSEQIIRDDRGRVVGRDSYSSTKSR